MEEISKQLENESKNLGNDVRKMIEWQYGAWNVTDVLLGSLSAYVYLTLKKNPTYTLRLMYRPADLRQEEGLRTNIAASGSFDVLSSDVAVYYKAVGKLLQHKEMLEELKQRLASAMEQVRKIAPLD